MNDRVQKLLAFLQDQPHDSFIKHALALEYVKLGEDGAARLQFESVLATDPGYVGSYYHLGRLLERTGEASQALAIYQQGIAVAGAAGDQHARNELQLAADELSDD